MYDDSTSVVKVTQYFKTLAMRDPLTGLPVKYRVALDWGIGAVDRDGLYTLGSPYQLFSDIYGDALVDTRVLVTGEELPLSTLPAAADMTPSGDVVHFKFPNI